MVSPSSRECTSAETHWNRMYAAETPCRVDRATYLATCRAEDRHLLEAIGPVDGLRVLEIGCGTGVLSVLLAKAGANVTAVDNAEVAVEKAAALAAFNGVGSRVHCHQADVRDLGRFAQRYDLVVGRFILHHLEPFGEFCAALAQMMSADGRGVFLENNGANSLLLWCRTHLAGRYGIPKFGDDEEHPFEARELASMRRHFEVVGQRFPMFVFFRLMSAYLLRDDPLAFRLLSCLDDGCHRYAPLLRPYSYFQIVEVQRPLRSGRPVGRRP